MAGQGYEFYLRVLIVSLSLLKIIFVSPTSGHVMFCLLYRYWNSSHLGWAQVELRKTCHDRLMKRLHKARFIPKKVSFCSKKVKLSLFSSRFIYFQQFGAWKSYGLMSGTFNLSGFSQDMIMNIIKLSFKNVNKENNKWEVLLLLADHVSNHDDINILTCER